MIGETQSALKTYDFIDSFLSIQMLMAQFV